MTITKHFKTAFALTAFAFLSSSTSLATITLQSITGASKASPVIAGNTTVTVYGGLAGPDCGGGTGTCDSCASMSTLADLSGDADHTGCNNNRISASSVLVIRFTSTTAGIPVICSSASTTTCTTVTPQSGSSSQISYAAGTSLTFVVRWSDICNGTFAGACDIDSKITGTNFTTGSFVIGVNPTSASSYPTDVYTITATVIGGIAATYPIADADCSTATNGVVCTYLAYPGDSKVTLQNLNAGNTGYPSIDGSNQQAGALRLYYSEASESTVAAAAATSGGAGDEFAKIGPNSGYAELPVDSTGAVVGNGRVAGLQNDKVYVFKLAHVDQAGNVGLFTATGTSDVTCLDSSDNTCHVAQPGAVEGVLSKNLNCFIATAAYGSTFASKVQTFRDFRNRFLLQSKLGQKFIRFYYGDFGPTAANYIRHNETLKAASRVALLPVWLFATVSLEIGFFGALLVSLAFLILVYATARVCSQHLRMDA